MAGGLREIEVKYLVDDSAALEKALTARGAILSAPVHQDDQAYAQSGWNYGQSKIGVTFLRLRTQQGRHLFTLKKPLDNAMACLEHETEIADREQMHDAIVAMGFHPTVRIVKSRRSARLDEVTVCVDEVEHAGVFVEFERTVAGEVAGIEVQRELDVLARSLGVGLERTTDTYDSLVRAALAPA
ncbi:class IV adenylate cyclase [Nonomuraea roseoviolacea]|uniref:Adenylate cyclase class 2 n=1 Tax=Nonomuraea roseoviolacea subsp. carminata TaxID=160689 RepID=A0ABT1JXR6_9ACTN|nr:class IV adenylate cyclase [Nonomuraea roseoviolacea]MCP2345559.1 adenylate cyclase class 2 [Nonomuraea roseoviolacea subsp. carminata]